MRERELSAVPVERERRLRRGSPPAPVEIVASEDPSGAPLITVDGELDLSNVHRLETAIDGATRNHPDVLVIDLRGVRFMDSSALHALFKFRKRTASLVLRAPSREARRVIELSGLASVARIES